MGTVLKRVVGWPFMFGGDVHSGWLPPEAVQPQPTPVERELLDVAIERSNGGYLLTWAARSSPTCCELRPPKVGDMWYETIEDAEAAAREVFGIEHEHWNDVT